MVATLVGVIYLDHAATTPMRPEAVAAMAPFFSDVFGNPSGAHVAARRAKTALEEAREQVAVALGARPDEIVFTAGGTEADNLAIKGAAHAGHGRTIVTTAFEHKGVLASCERLEREGFTVRRVPVDRGGIIDLDALAAALDDDTVVVSTMLVNNEVGTIQPLSEVAALVRVRAPRAVLHTDAVQAVPWLDVATAAADADLVAISAHKFGGPKGTGVLVVRNGVSIEPLIEGGGQERGLRSGTSNVAGAVGMATALVTTTARRASDVARLGTRRDRLAAGLQLPRNGASDHVVAGNLHVTVEGVEAEALLVALDQAGVCAAAGSSCSSGAAEPSHVLAAMGLSREAALSSVRFSLGWASTDADIDAALEVVPAVIDKLRSGRAVA